MPYLDDMRTGDELPALRKGPVNARGWSSGAPPRMTDYAALRRTASGEDEVARHALQGTFKYALMGQLVQRWLGAQGTLNRISASYRGLNLEGEIVTARARVASIDRDAARVTLEVWVENEVGAASTSGEAVVTLPRRA